MTRKRLFSFVKCIDHSTASHLKGTKPILCSYLYKNLQARGDRAGVECLLSMDETMGSISVCPLHLQMKEASPEIPSTKLISVSLFQKG